MKIENSQEFLNYLVQHCSQSPGAAIGIVNRLREAKPGDITVTSDLTLYESFKRTLPQKARERRKEVPLNQSLFAPMHDPRTQQIEEAFNNLLSQ